MSYGSVGVGVGVGDACFFKREDYKLFIKKKKKERS